MYKQYFNKLTTVGTRTEMKNTHDTIMYYDDISKLILRSLHSIRSVNVKSMSAKDNIIRNNPNLKGKISILTYGDSIKSMFQLFIDILKDATTKTITTREIKEILSHELNILLQAEGVKMKQTFSSQGKLFLTSKLEEQENIVDLVMSEHYYLSNVDIYILCKHFKINIIITSNVTTKLLEARNFPEKYKWVFSLNFNKDSKYYILKQESIKPDKYAEGTLIPIPQIYKLLQIDGQLKFHIKNFSYDFTKVIEENRRTTLFTKKHAKKAPNKIPLG